MNQKVVVFGANGLIGRAVAKGMMEAGLNVFMSDLAPQSVLLDNDYSSSELYIAADITNETQVKKVLTTALEKFGSLDAAINMAYPKPNTWGTPVAKLTYDEFCQAVNLHLGGYFIVTRETCALMAENGGGCVINFSSIYGTIAPDFSIYKAGITATPVEYAAIKAAIIQMSKYFAKYHLSDGVRVNTISPGGVENDHPLEFLEQYEMRCGKIGMLKPEDLLYQVMYLVKSGSAITGQNLIIDDGFSI